MSPAALLRPLILAAGLVTMASCATSLPAPNHEAGLGKYPKTALLVETDIAANSPIIARAGCRLSFKRIEDDQVFDFTQPPGNHLRIVELSAGDYWLKEVYCFTKAQFKFDEPTGNEQIHVIDGKLAYFGNLHLVVDHVQNELLVEPAKTLPALRALLESQPEADASRIISSSSGRTIPLAATRSDLQLKVKVHISPESAFKSHNYPNLTGCLKGEAQFPPLLGTLQFRIMYADGKFLSFELKSDESTAPRRVLDCFEKTAREYPIQTRDTVTLNYTVGNV